MGASGGFGIGMPALFLLLRLEVEVRGDRLSYWMYLIHLQFREVDRHEIVTAEAISYRLLWEYGGWGIRWGKTGFAYTVSGNFGVGVSLMDGTPFLIGSQRADELAAALSCCIYENREFPEWPN